MHASFDKNAAPSFRKLQLQKNYQVRKRMAAEKNLNNLLAVRVRGRIQHLWAIRVGLADPSIPDCTLRDWCADFPDVETKGVSACFIGAARDAFCAIILRESKQDITDVVVSSVDAKSCIFALCR